MSSASAAFYAVKRGLQPGIYKTWALAEIQTAGFSGAVFKKFSMISDAIEFVITKTTPSQIALESKDEVPVVAVSDKHKDTPDNKKRKVDRDDRTLTSPSAKISPPKNDTANINNKGAINSEETKAKKVKQSPTSSKKQPETSKTESHNKDKQPKVPAVNNNASSSMSKLLYALSFTVDLQNLLKSEIIDKSIQLNFEKKSVHVFTDGACSNNGNSSAAAGVGVFWETNHPLNVSKRLPGLQTNNRAEIAAAIIAIAQAIKYEASSVKILTDSMFMINCATNWIKNWKKNDWTTTGCKAVKNVDDLKTLDRLCSLIPVEWSYIQAHKGHFGNEEADRLAREALKLPNNTHFK